MMRPESVGWHGRTTVKDGVYRSLPGNPLQISSATRVRSSSRPGVVTVGRPTRSTAALPYGEAPNTSRTLTYRRGVRMWHCGRRASPGAWREPLLGVIVSFAQK